IDLVGLDVKKDEVRTFRTAGDLDLREERALDTEQRRDQESAESQREHQRAGLIIGSIQVREPLPPRVGPSGRKKMARAEDDQACHGGQCKENGCQAYSVPKSDYWLRRIRNSEGRHCGSDQGHHKPPGWILEG